MPGYFDHNATTPLCDAARDAWLEAQQHQWQNPSSLYRAAAMVRQRLEDGRELIGDLIGCEPERIIFNSGASEGTNAVIARAARHAEADQSMVISAIEHPCVREAAYHWFGANRVIEIPVTSDGRVVMDELASILTQHHPALVSIMAANNETGALQPWREIADLCRQHAISYHCDAAQWFGKMKDADFTACDWVTGSGHKFGGPKGVGWLVIPEHARRPLRLTPGGPQESGHRAGTEDYPAIAAMLAAFEEAEARDPIDASLRDQFEQHLRAELPGVRFLATEGPRLPNTSMVLLPSHSNLKWLTRLGEAGFAVSTGSACSAGKGNPSPVMAAMRLDHDEMGRVLRFSSGRETQREDWRGLATALIETGRALDERRPTRQKISLG